VKFAALGRTHWLLNSIEVCIKHGHDCVLIASSDPAPEYRVGVEEFADIASSLRCTFINTRDLTAETSQAMISEAGADVAISVNWVARIPAKVRALFAHGILNAHAGDVPRYRGNACPNWAILNGEGEAAVSLMQMDDGLDTGPVFKKIHVPIQDDTYISDLYAAIDQIVPTLFAETLDALQAGTARFESQPEDPEQALRCYPRRPEDGRINWQSESKKIARLVRASAEPFAGAYCFLEEQQQVIVWRAHAEAHPTPFCGIAGQVKEIRQKRGEVAVLAGDGLVVLEEVEVGNRGRVEPTRVVSSSRSRLT
jgi:UDP-4-amino-4-deoxy-L-arabinose formyltransferase/UDP-glucuronic acid dehydrogenase (UDP-4-keto-hexauronic acid decarboxylating)